MNLMETIHLHKNDFSKTEHKVYVYIVQNPTAIETATITKIAELCQVSTSGILRFCQVLGYKGYKDFRFDMLHYLHQEHVEVNSENLFDELTSKYLSVIRQFNNIDQNKLNQLIKQIKNTKNIYVIGVHYSSLPAKHLVLGLQDLGINTYFAYDYMQASHLYNTILENDLLIYFSIEGNQNNVSRFFDLTNASKNTYMITLNPKPKLLIENTLILPGYTLSKQSIVDLQSIVVIFVELLLNMFHNTLKED
ncbi:MurR/RpiR family transcriptional regulator [Coprobacillus sp. AF13-15]|nr:MurR/RpiR family transcriptional regulator [Coprobacillus sp. AF13-4LB]RHS17288.1 MurR/RpiR family transcriptional regulator [Coprobacillus sp. AF13-25]RHS18803.1 MurR/RpiR family transcriptional regulator [Coprobacillus sp. AF13-15]